ncbi:hypothetical protein ABBQ32_009906 [Trebouxia sp. C0010 RCD-2024]
MRSAVVSCCRVGQTLQWSHRHICRRLQLSQKSKQCCLMQQDLLCVEFQVASSTVVILDSLASFMFLLCWLNREDWPKRLLEQHSASTIILLSNAQSNDYWKAFTVIQRTIYTCCRVYQM